ENALGHATRRSPEDLETAAGASYLAAAASALRICARWPSSTVHDVADGRHHVLAALGPAAGVARPPGLKAGLGGTLGHRVIPVDCLFWRGALRPREPCVAAAPPD